MLLYFIRLLIGKGSLSDVLHTLELTQQRLDTFLGAQVEREREATVAVYQAQQQRAVLRVDTERARVVFNNLSNILASPTEATQSEGEDDRNE